MFFEIRPGFFAGFSFLFKKMNHYSENLFLLLYK